jgi:hypothetical protein
MAITESIPLVRLRLKPTLRLNPGGYLFDGATADSYTLNPSAERIVRALLDGCEPARLWCELVARFQVSEPRARRDVREFLSQLRQWRLLVEETPPAP